MRAPLPFLLWNLLVSTHAATIDLTYSEPAQNTCKEDIAASKLSPGFFTSITHAIHSITVEDLQFYFNANANETNNIPTVNQDLLSNDAILNHAPKAGSPFPSQAMKTMDLVLSNMDNKMWGAKNYNILERLLHAFHMQEMWSQAAVIYKEMVKEPPSEVSLCPCLTDVEHNGVFHRLRMAALNLREPVLMYNSDERLEPEGQQGRMGRTRKFKGNYYPEKISGSEPEGQQGRMGRTRKFKGNYYPEKISGREARKLFKTSVEDINIEDEASWQARKQEFMHIRPKMLAYEQALYFYCMLEM